MAQGHGSVAWATPARLAFLVSVLLHTLALVVFGGIQVLGTGQASQRPETLEVRLLPASVPDASFADPVAEPEKKRAFAKASMAKKATRMAPSREPVIEHDEEALNFPAANASPSRGSSSRESAPEPNLPGTASTAGVLAMKPDARPSAPSAAAPTPAAYLQSPEPIYPESAREDGEEGLVVLRVRISAQGMPAEVLVRQSSGVDVLDLSALRAVKHWKFVPATIARKPIESWMDVPVRFQLK